MDDANFPSLLSLPKFGFVSRDDPIYLNTRKYVLSQDWNPYFAQGTYPGIGSPHTGLQKPWPMALAMQAMTSTDETEISYLLSILRNTTAGTGFMHESFNVNNPSDYTRSWFAWANTVFGDLILYLEKQYPHLL
jgi:meiotically up-regulated gene 157 (Mug157) protein